MICVTSLPLFRTFIYEFFFASHFFLTITIVVSLWLHVSPAKIISRIHLTVGTGLWILLQTCRLAYWIFRNHVRGKPRPSVVVTEGFGGLHVTVTLPRPWKRGPGQYIYLSAPNMSIFSGLQRHPFMVFEWPSDDSISLLIQPKRGFTKQLLQACEPNQDKLTLRKSKIKEYRGLVYIEGPYGLQHNLGEYGTVIMFASGFGIASHVPYIKDLVRRYRLFEIKTRDIVLVWCLEKGRKK